jgi:hypothetical protein
MAERKVRRAFSRRSAVLIFRTSELQGNSSNFLSSYDSDPAQIRQIDAAVRHRSGAD